VGYLDDGTMVVVDGAHGRSGERLPVVITGALQTPTGRMVFGKLEGATGPSPAKPRSPGKKSAPSKGDPGTANPR
jgi:hypothetical protein